MNARTIRRQFVVEALEERALLAGNVLASLKVGTVLIRGDDLDNQISITQPVAGGLRVTGLDGTTINGQGFVAIPAGVRNLDLRLQQGGVDQTSILGMLDVPGNLQARLDAGSFLLDGSSGPVRIEGDLKVRSGAAGDVTIRNDVQVGGDTNVDAGGLVHVVAGQAALVDYTAASFTDSLTIDNPYFPLVVGTKYTYEGVEFDDAGNEVVTETIIVEVLPETRTIQGVDVRVVRDRVFDNGVLVEDTFDWYAQDDLGNVWYFGEDVTNFEYDDQGNLIDTNKGGSWITGVNQARAGVIMEADPQVDDHYYQEFAPAVELAPATVLDQGKVLAIDESITVPAGTFDNVVATEDTTAVEPDHVANKWYAPGLGSIREFDFDYLSGEVTKITRLVSAELNGQTVTEVVPPGGFNGTNVTGPTTKGIQLDGRTTLRARGSVIVRGAEFRGIAQLQSRTDVAIIESVFTDLTRLRGADAVSLRSVLAEGRIGVDAASDVYFTDSEFQAAADVRPGGGDNILAIEGCEFHSLRADGGQGHNTFEDRGGNSFNLLTLQRWVTD